MRTIAFVLMTAAFCTAAENHVQQKNGAVALIDGLPITERELNVQGKLLELESQAYQLRLNALENAVSRRLVEKAAAEHNMASEEFLKQKVDARIPDPSPQEVEAFYLGRRDKFGKPFDEVRDEAAGMLKSSRVQEARREFITKLRERSSVQVLLAPVRFPVEIGGAPRRGSAAAPVTVVEFSDFQCPYCKRAQATLREILAKYGDQVSLVFKDLPLTQLHPEAERAAAAAHCAGEQGKYWEYHDALFSATGLTKASYPEMARSLGLNADALQSCLDSGKSRANVAADREEAARLGVTSTPTFFVNGILVKGAQPLEAFTKIIDSELAARSSRR